MRHQQGTRLPRPMTNRLRLIGGRLKSTPLRLALPKHNMMRPLPVFGFLSKYLQTSEFLFAELWGAKPEAPRMRDRE